jgi:MFS family permease
MAVTIKARNVVRSDVPARLDRLPWSRWHWLVVGALGVTWIIDGLEVTMIGAFSGVLREPECLGFSSSQIGLLGTSYLLGAVIGAIVFGYLTDRLGRKRLFNITLGLYLISAFCTAFSWNFWSFAVFRFFTGAAIGGEYSAINSAIDELIPSRLRGRVDLAINGTFWLGAAAGSLASIILLDPAYFRVNLGWRLGFALGAALGLIVLFLRKYVPESPRWLLVHGKSQEASRTVREIEKEIKRESGTKTLPKAEGTIAIESRGGIGFAELARVMLKTYPTRTILGLSLVASQAFLYNGVSAHSAVVL